VKKNLLTTAALSALAALAVASCSNENTSTTGSKSDIETTTSKSTTAPAVSTPELGSFGIKTEDIDVSIEPGDDFFQHVGGKWMETFELPGDRASYGSFTVLADRSEKRVRKIIEDAASANAATGSVEQKIGDYFASFTDVDAINANGMNAIIEDLAYLANLETKDELVRAFARPDIRAGAPIGAFVGVDAKRPEQYTT